MLNFLHFVCVFLQVTINFKKGMLEILTLSRGLEEGLIVTITEWEDLQKLAETFEIYLTCVRESIFNPFPVPDHPSHTLRKYRWAVELTDGETITKAKHDFYDYTECVIDGREEQIRQKMRGLKCVLSVFHNDERALERGSLMKDVILYCVAKEVERQLMLYPCEGCQVNSPSQLNHCRSFGCLTSLSSKLQLFDIRIQPTLVADIQPCPANSTIPCRFPV